jgi:hypothetical protein
MTDPLARAVALGPRLTRPVDDVEWAERRAIAAADSAPTMPADRHAALVAGLLRAARARSGGTR